MENFYVQGEKFIPTIDLKTNGNFNISGKAIMEDSRIFFDPIFSWLEKLDVAEINMEINLEYFNTAVSKQINIFFEKTVSNPNVKTIYVNWHYEEGDDEMFESGMIYKENFPSIEFEFYVHAESF